MDVRRFSTPVVGSLVAGSLVAGSLVADLVGSAPPAVGAVGPACPEPFPAAEVSTGQALTGLTVVQGTTPEELGGEVLGRIEDGVLPGVDMLLVRLSSPTVERAGVWAGISGSPVYAADGRLVGAVAYGLMPSSPVAGVVPAEDMLELLPADVRPGGVRVAIPRPLARRLVAAGEVTAKEAAAGFRPVPVPVAVSGVGQRSLGALEERLESPWVHVVRGTVGRSTAAREAVPVTAGGNLVATLAYGDVTIGGTGTATAVCGSSVLGFGHPMLGSGWSRLGVHGGHAVLVQGDPVWGGAKLANVGEPVGVLRQDRMLGIQGLLGVTPRSAVVTATVTRGEERRTGRTDVYHRPYLAAGVLWHLVANIDRVLGLGGGTVRPTIRMTGTLPNGRAFTVRRDDVYLSGDVSWSVGSDIASSVWGLQRFAGTRVSTVDMTASVASTGTKATVKAVSLRRTGTWVPVRRGGRLDLPAGATSVLRVTLQRTSGGATWSETLRLRLPARAAGTSSVLRVLGGGSPRLDGTREAKTAAAFVAALNTNPSRADVVAHLALPRRAGGEQRSSTADAGFVVSTSSPFTARVRIR